MNNEAPEHVRLVKRGGILDGHWYYPDAAIMPYETEIHYRRVDPPAAPTEIGFVDAVEIDLLRNDVSTAKQLIDELLAECRLDKTMRGRNLLARVNNFIHGEKSDGNN